MLTVIIITGLSLLALYKLFKWTYPSSGNPSTVPGMPPSHPERGNLDDIGRAGSLHQFLLQLHRRYGSIASYWTGEKYTVSIASAHLFKEHCKAAHRPFDFLALFKPLFTQSSIAYATEEEALRRRAIYDPSFSHKVATEEYMPIFHRISDEIIENISKYPEGEPVPIVESMFIYATRCVTECMLGEHLQENETFVDFNRSYEYCWNEMEKRLDGSLPGVETDEKFEKERQNVMDIIREAIRKQESRIEDGNLFIDVLLRNETRRDVIEADLITFLIAGIHTSGYALAWALMHLSQNFDVQERCIKELKDVLGEEDLDPRVINDLKYLKQIMDETLRCDVMAPYAGREMGNTSGGILGGHQIPPETTVVHALGVSLQDDRVWPDPTKFDPERFANAPVPYTFEPFGFAGNRKCPGYRLSNVDVEVMLSKFLKKFKVKFVPGQKIEKVHGLVTKPSKEIYLTLERRN